MKIEGVSSSLYGESDKKRTPHQFFKPSVPDDTQDEVSLSPEAMKEFEKLAMYSGRAGEFLPKVHVLNNQDSHKLGYSAWESDFSSTYQAELNEYSSKFKTYYEETKVEHGILTADDHYEKVLKAESDNSAFQQDFEDRLSSDPRMLELMGILRIERPA